MNNNNEIHKNIEKAYNLLNSGDLEKTKKQIDLCKTELPSYITHEDYYQIAFNLGGVAIDYGSFSQNIEYIELGIELSKLIIERFSRASDTNPLSINHYYNLANGYSELNKRRQSSYFDSGEIPKEHLLAKENYRKAMKILTKRELYPHERDIIPQLFTNFGNLLEYIGRSIEAIDFYDMALKIAPTHPVALINKGITLKILAPYTKEHLHLFIMEAKRLIELAKDNSSDIFLDENIKKHLEPIEKFILAHKGHVEIVDIKNSIPINDFHVFLRNFCFKHQLYLTPSSLLGKEENQYFGDPLHIFQMHEKISENSKFEKYISFFNQIKQDFIFSRYLLIQSQYKASFADIIDTDVDYFHPLDYSVYSSYIEMLKVSYRLSIDTFDKIAFFIREYNNVQSIEPTKVNFRNIFSTRKNPFQLRSEHLEHKNKYLFGLFDLSHEMKPGEYLSFAYKRRNTLTHRFISIQEEIQDDHHPEVEKIFIDDFINENIRILNILKSAITYLILYVDTKERSFINSDIVIPIYGQKIDKSLRWNPSSGDSSQ